MKIDRKQDLLHNLIQEHIETGAPVGSKLLAGKVGSKLSPATIRNEMAELEKEGFISHPHTSAGRIPTAKGWKLYIDTLLQEKIPSTKQQKSLAEFAHKVKMNHEEALKSIARTLADMSQNASFVGFSANDVYYTGLSNLFNEPEFEDLELIRRMSDIVDHLDEVMATLFKEVDPGVHILVGDENPFGTECGVILNKYERDGTIRLYGILGPARMHYDINLGFVNFTNNLL